MIFLELRLQSLAICDSKSLRFGSLSTPEIFNDFGRLHFGSVLGCWVGSVLGCRAGSGWGRSEGGSVREKNVTSLGRFS